MLAKICFVILHYMALEETVNCVESIRNNVRGEKQIVVVDNCSPNGTGAELAARYRGVPGVKILCTGKNLGFARGNNVGYAYAVKHYTPDFVVVMNNDMEIRQEDFISAVELSYTQTQFAIMGPDIYSTKGDYHQNPQIRKVPGRQDLVRLIRNVQWKYAFRFMIPVKWFIKSKTGRGGTHTQSRRHSHLISRVDHVVENAFLHGSCYVFSPLFTKRHPFECFYRGTFMYMEAEILYYQARRDGDKMVYDPRLTVDHHEDVATDAEFGKQADKSIFTVKCMLQSLRAFLALMDRDGNL